MKIKDLAVEFKRAVWAVILLSILLCGIYPLAVWGIGQLFFSEKANGSLFIREKEVIGSVLLAQQFTSPTYFHSRPSAIAYAGSEAISGGSNLGPLSRALIDQATTRIRNYQKRERITGLFPDSCGCDHGFRQRPGSPYQPCQCNGASGPGRQGPGTESKPGSASNPERHGRKAARNFRRKEGQRTGIKPGIG